MIKPVTTKEELIASIGKKNYERITRIQAVPAKPKFKKGQRVTVRDNYGKTFFAEFLKPDGRDRSFISIKGSTTSVYTYQLSPLQAV